MTKSGIGTQLLQQQQQQQHNHQTLSNHNMNNLSNVSSSGSSSTSSLIANAEIPIWVSDKKKWVTGISKKTTVNDLIYAILKQCQILPTHGTNQLDLISNQYVLVEYTLLLDSNIDQFVSASSFSNLDNQQQLQRILNGDSKVYKYLNKWANSQLMTNQQQQQQTPLQSNLMLKILQRQPVDVPNSDTIEQQQHQQQQSTSLATKLLKKFGVTNSPTNNTTQSITNNNTKTVSQQILPNNGGSYRFVDVKLPMLSSSQSHPNQLNTSSSSSSNLPPSQTAKSSTNNLNQQQRNFDPNTQKSFLYNAIMEKDTKLKQQVKRFQLIDELLKETEKKSIKYPTSALLSQINSESVNNPTYTYSPSQSSSLSSTSSSSNSNQPQPPPLPTTTNESKQFNTVDLNDVYCHFPEMCTHHLKEVEDFTLMCSQLFQLEEAIKSQKQVLSNLELDLQKELNQNNHQQQQQQQQTMQQTTNIESVETVELRNEVNYSREQTRIQCKQLHDLDLRMRQNEQSLMVKEQQLQQLLEELYIQEIYADNALESAINTNTTNLMNNNNNNNSTSNIGLISPLHQKDHLMDTSTTRHSELIINNELNSNNNNSNNNNINYLTKRNVKMFGDSNDDMLINQALMQQKQHQSSIRINNLQSPQTQLYTNSTTNLHQKSQSIGNLAKSLPSPPPAPPTVLMTHHHHQHHNHHQQQQQQIKQINNNLTKSNQFINSNNINSDHSGDNDSGISSMSSETNTNPILNNTNTSRHIVQNNQFLNNQQQFQHVYNRQQQQQQTQQVSPAGKSVLETLV